MGLIVPHTIVRKRPRSRSLTAQEGKKENKIIESRNKLLLPQRLIQNVFNNPRIINPPPQKKKAEGEGGWGSLLYGLYGDVPLDTVWCFTPLSALNRAVTLS